MKKTYFLLMYLLVPLFSFGGGLKINLQSGYGSYSMTDLKRFNDMVVKITPLPIKQMDNFPDYWFYQGSIQFCIAKNFNLGPMYAYHSTGSRYSLADYSGEYLFDNLIHVHNVGLTIDYKLFRKNSFAFSLSSDGGVGFSTIKMSEFLEVTEADYTHTNNLKFNSSGYFVEPGFQVSYEIKFLEPGIQFGYYIPVAEKALKNADNGNTLYHRDGSQIKSGWDGVRLGLTLGINLSGK